VSVGNSGRLKPNRLLLPTCVTWPQSAVWVAVPYSATSRTRETIIRVQQLNRPPNEKHDRQKPEVGEPEPEVEADKSASASPLPAPDWEDVLTRDTTVEGQVRFGPVMRLEMLIVTLLMVLVGRQERHPA